MGPLPQICWRGKEKEERDVTFGRLGLLGNHGLCLRSLASISQASMRVGDLQRSNPPGVVRQRFLVVGSAVGLLVQCVIRLTDEGNLRIASGNKICCVDLESISFVKVCKVPSRVGALRIHGRSP